MESLRLKNYRCFEDTGDIPIKPLTFLVGSNSSGKSSFLKFFPLLKQSASVRKRGVFLWNGHYVDFKDFKNTLRQKQSEGRDAEDSMTISFDITNVQTVRRLRVKDSVINKIRLTFTLSQEEEHYDKLDKLEIELLEQTITCEFNNENSTVSIKIGNLTSDDIIENVEFNFTKGLLPRFVFKQRGRIGDEVYGSLEKISAIIDKYKPSDKIPNRLLLYPLLLNISPSKKEIGNIISRRWEVRIEDDDLDAIFDLLYFYNLNNIIDTINVNIFQFADNIVYIGPLREATDRYYRFQNLAIDEIEPDGSNLAMYLYNLPQTDRESLNEWLSSIFEIKINVKSDGGHVELNIIERDKLEQNLVDVGFGYTQVLPILVNIWKCLYKDALPVSSDRNLWKKQEHIIAIEQPELHLHPRMQAKLGVLLARVIKEESQNSQDKFCFIIETHSEVLLNKIGELVAFEKIAPEDISVVLFNAKQEDMENEVELAKYSEDGFLTNWPIGFFAEDVD